MSEHSRGGSFVSVKIDGGMTTRRHLKPRRRMSRGKNIRAIRYREGSDVGTNVGKNIIAGRTRFFFWQHL